MPWNEPGSGNSGNRDPWGNGNKNKGNQSPDLDQIIDNVRKRFGGGGGTGKRKGLFSPWLLILLVAVFYWGTQSFYQVDEGNQSIELRFGKFKQTVGAGLNFIAWPLEEKIVIDTQQLRTVEVGYRGNSPEPKEALMLTRDQNIVDVTMAVQYTIKSIEDLVFNVGDIFQPGGLERVVRSATESALREVVGGTEMDALLTTDRPVVDADTKVLLQKILDRYQTGILVRSIEIQDAKPPVQVRDAFDDVVRADQDRTKLTNQAEAYAKKLVPNARGEAARILQEAEAYKAKVVAEATGAAERFNRILIEYQKAPSITKKRMYIETMEDVLSDSSKVLIDQNAAGGNTLMYLPIDKIIENNQRDASGSTSARRDDVLSSSQTPSNASKNQTIDSRKRGGR
ncbi:MAG: FtsH protease activity modulator HflK [Arenicella sp.]|nr:FtsH protease activity modulator HflK [Arenicella sp.]